MSTTVYAVTYAAGFRDLAVTKHADFTAAQDHVDATPEHVSGVAYREPGELVFGGPALVELYNQLNPERPVKKFETRATAQRRVFDALESVATDPPVPVRRGPTQESTMDLKNLSPEEAAKIAGKDKTKDKAPRTPPAPRPMAGKPAGAELKPAKEGSVRASVIKLMTGEHTVEEIAKRAKVSVADVKAHLHCTARDCGIGYDLKDGKVTALFPAGKTMADAVKPAAEKKVKKVAAPAPAA
jgi:hypothetical protein